MALTRKFLKAMDIDEEKIDQIIDAHTETIDSLKASLETAQAEAGKLPEIQKQLEAAQTDLEAAKKDSYKVKYEAIKEDFEAYKAEQSQKETRTAKEAAYRALLKAAGMSEKRVDSVLRVSDVDGLELTGKGEIKGADKLTASIREEWADFIETTEIQGADTPQPFVNTGVPAKSKEEIMNIKDTEERQKAMAESHELFGI